MNRIILPREQEQEGSRLLGPNGRELIVNEQELLIVNWDLPERLTENEIEVIQSTLYEVSPHRTDVTCVDGRECEHGGDYVQTLGGSLHSIPWIRFSEWMDGNEITFSEAFDLNNQLHRASHLRIGVHTGPHADLEKGITDCGFADKLPLVIETIGSYGDELKTLLNHAAEQNSLPPIVDDKNEVLWHDIVQTAQRITQSSRTNNRQKFLSGVDMFRKEQQIGGESVETRLLGEHQEKFANITLRTGSTTNAQELNQHGLQGFNLDLWYALDEVYDSKPFREGTKITPELASLLSFALYQATERVLRKDEQPIPILVSQ